MTLHTRIAESSPKENNRRTRACDEMDSHTPEKQKENKSQAQSSSIAALALDWVGISGVWLRAKYARRLDRCVGLRGRVSLRHVLVPS